MASSHSCILQLPIAICSVLVQNLLVSTCRVATHEQVLLSHFSEKAFQVLLKSFAGEKPLRLSQISRKFDPLQSNYCVLARFVCIYH